MDKTIPQFSRRITHLTVIPNNLVHPVFRTPQPFIINPVFFPKNKKLPKTKNHENRSKCTIL